MGDLTVHGSTNTAGPTQTESSDQVENNPTPETQTQPEQNTQPGTTSPGKAEVSQQHGAQLKNEHNSAGSFRQKELNQKLSTQKTQTKEFPPEAGNAELGKINVHRHANEDRTITQYPNGVKYKKEDTYKTFSKDVHTDSSNKVQLQKAGSRIRIEVEAPPGGYVTPQEDGTAIITDGKGKKVGTLDKDGNLQTQSKHGEYTQNPDGGIKFHQKEKGNLESLRKPGPISPADYEKYGITTDGKTLRFPNGVEISREKPKLERTMDGGPLQLQNEGFHIHIPPDIGKFAVSIKPPVGMIIDLNREPLIEGDINMPIIPTHGGQFTVRPDGTVIFEPSK